MESNSSPGSALAALGFGSLSAKGRGGIPLPPPLRAVPLPRFAGQDDSLPELTILEIDGLAVLIGVNLAGDLDGVADAQRGELGFGAVGPCSSE